MSSPSNWPLPPESIRFVVPHRITHELSANPLSSGLYPLGIGYYRQAYSHQMKRQEHDDNLLIYCLEGEGEVVIEGQHKKIYSGDILLIPPGIPHFYQACPKNPWSIYWVHFYGADANSFVAHLQKASGDQDQYVIPVGIHSRLVSSFESLIEVRESTYNIDAYILAANQLRQILSYIALLLPLARQYKSKGGLDIEKVHSIMQAHIHEQLDLDTLSESVNLSKYHLVKKYKEITGTTPINHFIQLKIERACHLLDSTNNGIHEISFAVGYEDAYYFSRIFKKMMGISPSQYRKMRVGAYPYKR